jgi:hypothetical protein
MKNIILSITILFSLNLKAQEVTISNPLEANFKVGNALDFKFNDGDYLFKIGGMIQPFVGIQKDSTSDAKYFLNAKRTYFNISGKAAKEKISFLIQTDFSLSTSLLDAWVAYMPYKNLKFTVGQVQTFTNNKEMNIMENQLQFIDRSLVSDQFSATGREFGLFIESQFKLSKIGIVPQVAITSGDGRNSFGASSIDYDFGGLKYAGRLNLYPLGYFTEGNSTQIADIKKEPKPKLVMGISGSYNQGASNSKGEGHGSFLLYNELGKTKLPDYRKLYYDLHFKYKGFSFLTEYVIATAKVTEGTFTDLTGTNEIQITQISQFLALGTGLNTQLGYVYHKKYGIDFRYSMVTPEFAINTNSLIKERNEWTVGLTKYVDENNLKYGTSLSQLSSGKTTKISGSFFVQIAF